jgi:hypothetical protein
MMAGEAFGSAALRRIEWLTLALGGIGGAWAARHWGWRGGVGLVVGAILSWINFRWLKGSVQAFGKVATIPAVSSSPSSDSSSTQPVPQVAAPGGVPVSAYLKFFGRFALLLGTVYVILTRSSVPAVSVLAGLFASAAAVVLALVYELITGGVRQSTGSGS